MVTPKGSMSTEGETLQVSVLPYRCSIWPPCCVCLSVLVVAQASSKVPEGLKNYPVYWILSLCSYLNVWDHVSHPLFKYNEGNSVVIIIVIIVFFITTQSHNGSSPLGVLPDWLAVQTSCSTDRNPSRAATVLGKFVIGRRNPVREGNFDFIFFHESLACKRSKKTDFEDPHKEASTCCINFKWVSSRVRLSRKKRLVASPYLSVRPLGACNTATPLGGFSWNLLLDNFKNICQENPIWLKSD